MVPHILNHLVTGEAYTIRIMRDASGYSVHITMSAQVNLSDGYLEFGACGIDINPDNISLSIIDKKSNFKVSKIFKFPEINYVSANKRDFIVGNTVKKAVNYVKSLNIKVIVVEDLSFRKDFSNNNNLNRVLSNFAHSKIVNTIGARCYKENLVLLKVNPSYTSLMGKLKYQRRFGISIHESAALCIARKGLGFKEKLPKDILRNFFAMEVKDKIKIAKDKYIVKNNVKVIKNY